MDDAGHPHKKQKRKEHKHKHKDKKHGKHHHHHDGSGKHKRPRLESHDGSLPQQKVTTKPPPLPPFLPSPPRPNPTTPSAPLALTAFTAEAKARFPELTAEQWGKLEALGALVQEWNGKVNVISRKDIENVLPRHVLPCMGISKLLAKVPPGTKLMDVGTGGGFPGLPLAICCPHVQFLLVDSIGKKVKVVADMAARLGLKNVAARHTRVEEVREKFTFITGRSVTAMPRFVGWVQDKFAHTPVPPNHQGSGAGQVPQAGILYIKGGISDENQEEDLGGWVPTERYTITELIGGGVYEGDKSVLHFSVQDLQRGPKRKK